MTNKPNNQSAQEEQDKKVHLRHCYQGEYEDSCKYGEENCPAKNQPAQEVENLAKDILASFNNYALTHEEIVQAMVEMYSHALQSKAVGYSLEEVKEIARKFTRAATQSKFIQGIDERFEQVWNLNFPQSLTPTPIQTKGRVCNGKDIRCDNPSMDRNGNCRNCQGDMQTIL